MFELGSRWLRAGFEGDSTPMCVMGFGPEESRRAGDYRGWMNYGSSTDSQQMTDPESWARAHELWRMDLRDVDLGLVEDKIERVIREAYNTYLLTDAGTARLVLTLPSLMPHPLIAAVLSTLFNRWRFPSITLLPGATMSTTAAGVRSALVVDLGWAETTAVGVYEYREVANKRSTRAMKSLVQETAKFLSTLDTKNGKDTDGVSVSFEYCEEVVSRLMWCKPRGDSEEKEGANEETDTTTSVGGNTISIPLPSDPGAEYIDLPFARLTEPVEKTLFAQGMADCDLDDEEKPIPLLVYNTLLSLPPDARGLCMSRIIFVGGGSNIPGIRQRILNDVSSLIKRYGWSQVRGKVIERQRQKLQNLSISSTTEKPQDTPKTEEPVPKEEPPEIDFVEQKLQRSRDKDISSKPPVQGVLREVESLGPWAGASLVASLKVRGLVEIEREKYLQQGLAGASRDLEHGYVPDRRSGLRTGGDRSSWTLGGWG